jgi:hypothetical protein
MLDHTFQIPDASVSGQVGTTVAAPGERVETFSVDDAPLEALEALRMGRSRGATRPEHKPPLGPASPSIPFKFLRKESRGPPVRRARCQAQTPNDHA